MYILAHYLEDSLWSVILSEHIVHQIILLYYFLINIQSNSLLQLFEQNFSLATSENNQNYSLS